MPEALEITARRTYPALAASVIFDQAAHYATRPIEESVPMFGQSCDAAEAFPLTLSLALRFADQPKTALIENVMAGGDSAARGLVLGLLMGAAQPDHEWIPQNWFSTWHNSAQLSNLNS